MKIDLMQVVKSCLEQLPETRDSDNKLIYAVYRKSGVGKDETFASVINKVINGDLPAFASITRAKRKVVELNPELDCSAPVKAFRQEQEEQYKALARVGR